MQTIQWINRLIAFLIEIAMLILLAYCGFHIGETTIWKYLLAIILPVAVAILWGIFAAPKSGRRLTQPIRMVFKIMLFISCALLLYKTDNTSIAILFGAIAILNEIIAFLLKD